VIKKPRFLMRANIKEREHSTWLEIQRFLPNHHGKVQALGFARTYSISCSADFLETRQKFQPLKQFTSGTRHELQNAGCGKARASFVWKN
jgi:hypothetical protein